MLDRRQLIDHFRKLLAEEQAKRPSREKYVRWGDEDVPEWLKAELEMLRMEVNLQRRERGLRLVQMRDIRRLDTMASGHSDYSVKLAIYCAELSVGDSVTP